MSGPGPVERKYRAWVRKLGKLSPRQAATAEQVYALAAQLDAARGSDEPLSAVASCSRELRQAAGELRDVATVAPPVPATPQDTVDEVATKRAARRRKAGVDG